MSWPLVSINDVAKVVTGKTPSKKEEDNFGGDIPFVTPGELGKDIYVGITPQTLSAKGASAIKLIPKNSVMVCCIGSLGKVSIAARELGTNQQINSVVFDEELVDPKFGYYALGRLKPKMEAIAPSTTVAIINKSNFEALEIPFPPLKEQKRIAAILDKADNLRRKRQQAIQLADEFLRAVFLDMFGDVITSEENVASLGDIVNLDAKMVDPTQEKFADLVHIGPDRIAKESGKLLPALTAREEGLISKKFLFNSEYVLYSKIRPYLRKCALAEGEGLCSADMYPIRPVEGKATKEFIWMLLLSDYFTNYTMTLPDRASIPKLNKTELKDFQFKVPSINAQRKFSEVVKKLLENNYAVVSGVEAGEELFSSISQKAFSGQL